MLRRFDIGRFCLCQFLISHHEQERASKRRASMAVASMRSKLDAQRAVQLAAVVPSKAGKRHLSR